MKLCFMSISGGGSTLKGCLRGTQKAAQHQGRWCSWVPHFMTWWEVTLPNSAACKPAASKRPQASRAHHPCMQTLFQGGMQPPFSSTTQQHPKSTP